MKRQYIITGANGHLGNTIIRILKDSECSIRGLILPDDPEPELTNAVYYRGDVLRPESLEPLFEGVEGAGAILIHAAGIVDVSEPPDPKLHSVNVDGTKNVAELCKKHGVRMVYVSSVHAIPESKDGTVLTEPESLDPNAVLGSYAKSKAEATQFIFDEIAKGLDAVIVYPSGIIGPYGDGGYMEELVRSYMEKKLPAGVQGGYDFVDVRDVAKACITAGETAPSGSSYILSNCYTDMWEFLEQLRSLCGGKKLAVLPVWLAKAALPLLKGPKGQEGHTLYSKYALHTLSSGARFSHAKALKELKFNPRDINETLSDTVKWMKGEEVTEE